MINQLNIELNNFKSATLRLIKALQEENYEVLDELLSERQECIDKLNSINHTRSEISVAYTELELMELEEQLTELMKVKLHETEDNINELVKSKSARKSYNSKFNVDSIYVNKKI